VEARANMERTRAAHVGPGEGRAVWVLGGQLLTYKVTAEQTGGAYSLFEGTVPPGGGAPPHIHHREDESFYVVDGEFEFSRDGETIKAGPGSLVYVPRGSLHAFENVGGREGHAAPEPDPRRPARALLRGGRRRGYRPDQAAGGGGTAGPPGPRGRRGQVRNRDAHPAGVVGA